MHSSVFLPLIIGLLVGLAPSLITLILPYVKYRIELKQEQEKTLVTAMEKIVRLLGKDANEWFSDMSSYQSGEYISLDRITGEAKILFIFHFTEFYDDFNLKLTLYYSKFEHLLLMYRRKGMEIKQTENWEKESQALHRQFLEEHEEIYPEFIRNQRNLLEWLLKVLAQKLNKKNINFGGNEKPE